METVRLSSLSSRTAAIAGAKLNKGIAPRGQKACALAKFLPAIVFIEY